MSRAVTADMSVFTIDGASYLAIIDGVTYTHDVTTAEGRAVNSRSSFKDAVKRRSTIDTGIMSNVVTTSGSPRVSNLDVATLSIGTTSYTASLRGGDVSITAEQKDQSAVMDGWELPVWVAQSITGKVKLAVPTAAFPAIMATAHGSFTGLNLAIAIGINGVNTVYPAVVNNVTFTANAGDVQMVEVSWEQRGPVTTGPATTSLLGLSISAASTSVPVVLTTRASGGLTYSGNFVITGASFSFEDSQIISTRYTMTSTGVVTTS